MGRPSERSSFSALAEQHDEEPQDNTFLQSLKGLSFPEWNRKVGLPYRADRGYMQFPLPFQQKVYDELMKEDGSNKDHHISWLGSRGLSKTLTSIRILCYLITRDDSLRGSEAMIITGARASLSYNIISRVRQLMHKANLEDSSMTYVNINGVKVEGYPADPISGRGKEWVSVIIIDENFWDQNITHEVLDMVSGYWVKNPKCYTILTSTPSRPGDLMDQIFQQEESETAWRRLKMDYTYGEGTIYTQKDLASIRTTDSWNREMLLRWSPKAGSTFLPGDIERAKCPYDISPISTDRVIAIDPASQTTGD